MRYYGVQNEVKSYLNRLQSEEGIEVSLGTVKTLNDRVEALKKSGVWSQYGLGFNDGDADRYFQRATVRNAIGRFEVCLFVRGMKTLGLWQNMVSWPMRSYQNAGTGSTVYSLGGLGTFNGSMINSPTWGTNGVNFIPSSYINAVNYPNYPYTGEGGFGLSIFSVVNPLGWLPNSTSRNLALLGGWDYRPVLTLTTGVGGGDSMALQKSVVAYNYTPLGGSYINNYMRIYGSPSINTTYYKNSFFFAGYSPGSSRETCLFTVDSAGQLNGANSQPQLSYGIVPVSPVQLKIGSMDATTSGLISISSLINVPITLAMMQLLRQLYKLTLGSSLALP